MGLKNAAVSFARRRGRPWIFLPLTPTPRAKASIVEPEIVESRSFTRRYVGVVARRAREVVVRRRHLLPIRVLVQKRAPGLNAQARSNSPTKIGLVRSIVHKFRAQAEGSAVFLAAAANRPAAAYDSSRRFLLRRRSLSLSTQRDWRPNLCLSASRSWRCNRQTKERAAPLARSPPPRFLSAARRSPLAMLAFLFASKWR